MSISTPMAPYRPPSSRIPPEMVPLLRAIHEAAIQEVPPRLTVEDARRALAARGDTPPANPNAWGEAFSHLSTEAAIRRVGTAKSYWPEARGRTITVWEVVDFRAIRRLIGDRREEEQEDHRA